MEFLKDAHVTVAIKVLFQITQIICNEVSSFAIWTNSISHEEHLQDFVSVRGASASLSLCFQVEIQIELSTENAVSSSISCP